MELLHGVISKTILYKCDPNAILQPEAVLRSIWTWFRDKLGCNPNNVTRDFFADRVPVSGVLLS